MAREYVGAGNLRRSQQSVKIGDDLGGGAGRRRGVASAPQAVGRVVAACAGELGHPILHFGPVRRQPALKDDRGAARARAVQEELAPADVEAARVGTNRLDDWRRLGHFETEDARWVSPVELDAQRTPLTRLRLEQGDRLGGG